jgi:membrane protein YdbS with pleckstrin-like domain
VAYSDLILRDNETLVLDLHPHWWYFAKALIATVLALILAIVVLAQGWSGTPGTVGNFITALLLLGGLVWLAERYAHWVSTYFILTSDRIIYREGIFAKHGMEIPLQRINSIFFNQRMFERILGLGDLKIESASKTGAEVFDDIRRPERVQHEIYSQMEALENRGYDRIGQQITQAQSHAAPVAAPPSSQPPPVAPAVAPAPGPPPAAPSASVADRIAELHRLHTQGAITDAEFEAKKAQLLDQL